MSAVSIRWLVALLLITLLGLGWLAYQVATGRSFALDSHIRETIHEHASAPLTEVMIGVSFIGKPVVILPVTAVVITLFWRFGQKHRAILFVIAMAGEIPI